MIVGLAVLTIWSYLVFARGAFWRGREFAPSAPVILDWPDVIAVVPARDEALCVGEAIGSLIRQNYPGSFSIILVDDQSSDGTALIAHRAATEAGLDGRLEVLHGLPVPPGWTGKLWAMKQGYDLARARSPRFVLFTDADIVYEPDVLSSLVGDAVENQLVLTSLMVDLRCASLAERALIPAFIFFFQMLYPFAWVNRADRATAAAAGGCMLVSRTTLEEAGGLEAIRSAWIDDCALAALLKRHGAIRLALTKRVASNRSYDTFAKVGKMISRSAYAQLGYSPILLTLTVAAMTMVFVAPVWLSIFATGFDRVGGIAAWLMMTTVFQPTLRSFNLSPLWGVALPGVAIAYICFTLDSAWQCELGRGGVWKGRAQAKQRMAPP